MDNCEYRHGWDRRRINKLYVWKGDRRNHQSIVLYILVIFVSGNDLLVSLPTLLL